MGGYGDQYDMSLRIFDKLCMKSCFSSIIKLFMFKINEFMINVPDRKKYVLPSRIFDFNVHSFLL